MKPSYGINLVNLTCGRSKPIS